MIQHASLFSQLIALIDRKKFHQLVYRHQTERFAKKFNSWEHFVSMFFCQIAQAKMADLNANDVEAAMKIVEGTARSMGLTVKG